MEGHFHVEYIYSISLFQLADEFKTTLAATASQ